MSEDLLRTARQLAIELDATEAYLRAIAVESGLPYARIMALERRANRRCAEILTAFGTAFEFALDDTTDELLLGRRSDKERVRQSTATQTLSPKGSYDALDEGPEGAADRANDLRSDEVARGGRRGFDRPPQPPPVDDEPVTIQAQRLPRAMLESEPVTPARRSSDDLFDNLVTFDDPVVSATPETVMRTVTPPVPVRIEPVAAQALVSDDDDEDDIDLGLDSLPELGHEDISGFDDDEVTVVKTPGVNDGTAARNLAEKRGGPPPRPGPGAPKPGLPTRGTAPTPAPSAPSAVSAPSSASMARAAPSRPPPASPARPSAARPGESESRPTLSPKPAEPKPAVAPTAGPPRVPASVRPAPPGPVRPPPKVPTAAAVSAASASAASAAARQPAKAGAPAGRVTSGLYGGSSVPTIRESDEPRPRAAAVQLNATGSGGRVIGAEEEDEPIEIGAADFEDDLDDGGGGFSVKLQQDDESQELEPEEESGEIGEEDLEVIQPAQVVPLGPTPDEVRQMVLHAQNAAASGDLQAAADLYSDVIDADPDSVPAHVARGRLYLDLGDYSRAMSDFMVAEDIAPEDPEPQVAIGDLYFARKDYAKAIEYFNDALKFSPNHPMAHCRRGISHYYRKNYREAVDDLLRAERLDPDIPNIQTYVSMARKKIKR